MQIPAAKAFTGQDMCMSFPIAARELTGRGHFLRSLSGAFACQCRELLHRWLHKNGKKATLQVLKQALIKIDQTFTAEKLEENAAQQDTREQTEDFEGQAKEGNSGKRKHSSKDTEESLPKRPKAQQDKKADDGKALLSSSLVEVGDIGQRNTQREAMIYDVQSTESWKDYSQALMCFEQSLQMKKRIYGKDTANPDIAVSLDNMGKAWSNLGDYEKAISYHDQTLQMRRSIYGETTAHPDIAASLDNLGNALTSLGDQRKTTSCHEQTGKIDDISDVVMDPDKFEERIQLFKEHAEIYIQGINDGSSKAYRDGLLSKTLSQEFITDHMRAEEGEGLYVHVTLLGTDQECQDDCVSDEEEVRILEERSPVIEETLLPCDFKQEQVKAMADPPSITPVDPGTWA
ncbi:Hypp3350 [Branchiostoma lanceolatum]|uniref:Hypp3350 protein n=1 Tax=Branchiostoma lanceolatum TaxID=7740 RepID=A0A8K0ERW6_BRALA|nr:Hypp3350 [Branchiostoma lanceolatum]